MQFLFEIMFRAARTNKEIQCPVFRFYVAITVILFIVLPCTIIISNIYWGHLSDKPWDSADNGHNISCAPNCTRSNFLNSSPNFFFCCLVTEACDIYYPNWLCNILFIFIFCWLVMSFACVNSSQYFLTSSLSHLI